MTALKAHEVERFLKRPDLDAGILLVYGPDTGLARETAQRLVRHYTGSDGDGMGLVTLDGNELDGDPGRLLVESRTSSLFGEKRVVRVRSAAKSAAVPLAELAADPSGAIVVLEAGNLAPRDPLRALVEAAKTGRALPCYADSDETILKLINENFAAAGSVRRRPTRSWLHAFHASNRAGPDAIRLRFSVISSRISSGEARRSPLRNCVTMSATRSGPLTMRSSCSRRTPGPATPTS